MKNYCYTCMEEIQNGNFCMTCMKENEPDRFGHHMKPGTILHGKYLVGNCIGEGGFGITYIGRDLTLDIKVAIKEYYPNGYVNRTNDFTQMVTTTTESQREFFSKGKEQFLQEARNIAKFIGEPGIVDVREFFEENNTAYIIMEYLDGEDLSSYVRKHGTIDAEELFKLVLPMVHSLQKIHEAGIIHRDISPDNIMYRRNGSLTLMDFGSARFFTNEAKELSVMLKQGYAPEEQYRKNGDQGPWTDVYGLCATIYRCITGEVPEDALDRMRADNLKKPSQLGVSISESLEKVLMYGLEVFKENRCKDMKELDELIRKAQRRQKISLDKGEDVRAELYRTKAADEPVEERYHEPARRMKTCPRCKTGVPQNVNYCTNCGYDFQGNSYRPAPPTPHGSSGGGSKLLYAILGIVVALLGVIVFYLVSNNHDGGDNSDDKSEPTAAVEMSTPEPTATPEPTPTAAPEPDYLLPDSATRYLTQADLYGLSREELCFARNEIFARHGRIFNTPAIKAYFEGKDWYHGTIPPDRFSSDVLNVYERANIELIVKVEDSMGGSYY